MTMATDNLTLYPSRSDLQKASDILIESLPDDSEKVSDTVREENARRIAELIDQIAKSGALLDASGDRRFAQGLIDFWTAKSLTATFDNPAKSRRAARAKAVRLQDFDSTAVMSAITKGDAVLASLDDKGKELTRQILLRMVSLARDGNPTATTIRRHDLFSLGNQSRINELVEALINAAILRIVSESPDQLLSLSYEALVRRWDPLRKWVDDRRKLHDSAVLWLGSNRSTATLPSSLPEKEYGYSDLTELEVEFLAAYRRRERIRRAIAAVIAAALLIIPVAGILLFQIYEQYNVDRRMKAANDDLRSPDASDARKATALNFLLENGHSIEFNGGKLRKRPSPGAERLTLVGGESPGAKFIQAQLSSVNFPNVALPFALFSQSILKDVDFTEATLPYARFDGAIIGNTLFSRTNLNRSIFDRALFCQGVQFAVSNVRSASFRDVTFADNQPPRFVGTAWWLALGWSMDQVEKLRSQSTGVDYQFTDAFQNELRTHDRNLAESRQQGFARAVLLNEKAWALATYGVNLGQAEATSKESLSLIPSERDDELRHHVQDTLAYILMQQPGKMGEALALLTEAEAKSRSTRNGATHLFSITFRLAVAQFAQGQNAKGLATLRNAMSEGNYVPTHELNVLWDHVSKEGFRATLEELLKKNRPQGTRPAISCATVQQQDGPTSR